MAGLRGGTGVVELAAKYKIVHQDDKGWTPDLAVSPRVFIPTNSRFGPPQANPLPPVWAEKDFGPWHVFGGGGYQINPGAGQRNFWQGGLAVNRTVSRRLSLGVEVFSQTRDTREGGGFPAVDFGVSYNLIGHWSLLTLADPTWNQNGGNGDVFLPISQADYRTCSISSAYVNINTILII